MIFFFVKENSGLDDGLLEPKYFELNSSFGITLFYNFPQYCRFIFFKGMSTFLGYSLPNPLFYKDSRGTI